MSRSVDAVSELGFRRPKVRPDAVKLLSTVMRETGDESIRRQCEAGLHKLGAPPAVNLASLDGISPAGVEAPPLEFGQSLTGAK